MNLIKKDEYIIDKRIAAGSFGTVYKVKKEDGELFAMKQIWVNDKMQIDDYRRQIDEMNILFFHKCPYLLRGIDLKISTSEKKLNIVTEFYSGGNLSDYIHYHKRHGKTIPNDIIWTIFLQLSLGVQYLHENNIIHRDIKPANILLDNDKHPTKAVICDFGSSICLPDMVNNCYTKIGTPYFMSPEQYDAKYYDQQTDIWSLGCILYEMLTLEKPFVAANIVHLRYKVAKSNFTPILSTNNLDSRFWNRILRKMLEKKSEDRINILTLLDMPQIKTKLSELNIHHHYRKPKLDIPFVLKNKNVVNIYGLSKYIEQLEDAVEKESKPKIFGRLLPKRLGPSPYIQEVRPRIRGPIKPTQRAVSVFPEIRNEHVKKEENNIIQRPFGRRNFNPFADPVQRPAARRYGVYPPLPGRPIKSN